jgi:hypothetical protein
MTDLHDYEIHYMLDEYKRRPDPRPMREMTMVEIDALYFGDPEAAEVCEKALQTFIQDGEQGDGLIIEAVRKAMNEDPDADDGENIGLIEIYAEATPEQRIVLNKFMSRLCAWSMATLVRYQAGLRNDVSEQRQNQ